MRMRLQRTALVPDPVIAQEAERLKQFCARQPPQ